MTTDNLDQEKRSALLDKISALLAKTNANGCTEAEALAAAELAQKLMAKYGLGLSELETISSPLDAIEVDGTPIGDKRCHEIVRCAHAIAFYTDTKSWYNGGGIISGVHEHREHHEHRGMILCYFGLPADVQVAIYLTQTLRSALDSEWRAFWRDAKDWNAFWSDTKQQPKASAQTARASFMEAMTMSLSDRLIEMKEEQSQSKTNDCRAIVLAKERIVDAAFDATGIRLRKANCRGPSGFDESAWDAGSAAGDRVNINSGALEGGADE